MKMIHANQINDLKFGFIECDILTGNFIHVSVEAAQIFGFDTVNDLYKFSRNWDNYMDSAFKKNLLEQIHSTGSAKGVEICVFNILGEEIWISSYATMTNNGNLLLMFEDITEKGHENHAFNAEMEKYIMDSLKHENSLRKRVANTAEQSLVLEVELKSSLHEIQLQREHIAMTQENVVRMERSVVKYKKRFTDFMNHFPGMAFIKDIEGRYIFVNKLCEKVTRLKQRKWINRSDDRIFDAQMSENFKLDDDKIIKENLAVDNVIKISDNSDSKYWELKKFPIVNKDNVPIMIGCIGLDVSENVQRENTLKEELDIVKGNLQNHKDNFISILNEFRIKAYNEMGAGIINDLNQSLTGILAISQNVLQGMDPLSPHRSSLELIQTETLRITDLIENVSSYIKSKHAEDEIFQVNDVVRDALVIVSKQLKRKSIHIVQHLDSQLPPVVGDKTNLQHAIVNVLTNCMESIEEVENLKNRSIQIKTQLEHQGHARKLQVTFSDSGNDIPISLEQHLFDPFFTTKKGSMRGFGLSLSRQILRKMRGDMYFTRNPQNKKAFVMEFELV